MAFEPADRRRGVARERVEIRRIAAAGRLAHRRLEVRGDAVGRIEPHVGRAPQRVAAGRPPRPPFQERDLDVEPASLRGLRPPRRRRQARPRRVRPPRDDVPAPSLLSCLCLQPSLAACASVTPPVCCRKNRLLLASPTRPRRAADEETARRCIRAREPARVADTNHKSQPGTDRHVARKDCCDHRHREPRRDRRARWARRMRRRCSSSV